MSGLSEEWEDWEEYDLCEDDWIDYPELCGVELELEPEDEPLEEELEEEFEGEEEPDV